MRNAAQASARRRVACVGTDRRFRRDSDDQQTSAAKDWIAFGISPIAPEGERRRMSNVSDGRRRSSLAASDPVRDVASACDSSRVFLAFFRTNGVHDDRSALLADAERQEGHDPARRIRHAVPRRAVQHRPRRSVHTGISEDQSEQPHAGDGRRRTARRRRADRDLRIGRDHDVHRREGRKVLSAGAAQTLRRGAVDHLADGEPGTEDRRVRPLPPRSAKVRAISRTRCGASPTR